MAENNRYRKPKNQPIIDTDPTPLKLPSIIQSTRCKSTISSLLLSSPPESSTPKKKSFTTFRGLGCAASAQVSVPEVIRTSANWEAKKVRKNKEKKNKGPFHAVAMVHGNSAASSSTSVVDPAAWCGPGLATEPVSSVDCVASSRPVSGRGKVDGQKMNHREVYIIIYVQQAHLIFIYSAYCINIFLII